MLDKSISIKKNFIYSMLYQILALITPLITAPYVSRVLNADTIGKYSYTQSIVMYFTLIASLGSGIHGQRVIAGYRDSMFKLSKAFYELVILHLILTLFAVVTNVLFMLVNKNDYWLYIAWIFNIIANAFDIIWFYQGLENFKKTVTRQIIIKLIGVVTILIFVKNEDDLVIYILCHSIPTLIGNLFLWPGVHKYIEKVKVSELNIREHFKQTILLFIPYIATLLFSYVDKTMLGAMCESTVENGYYEQASRFISIAISVVTALSAVLVPRMTFFLKKDQKNYVEKYAKSGIQAISLLSFLLAGGLIVVGNNLIPWFYGDGYEKSIGLLIILALMLPFKAISNFEGSALLIPAYKQNKYSIGIWTATILNILVNAVLIPRWMAAGACVASVLSEIFLFFLLSYYTRDLLDIKMLISTIYKYIIAAVIMILIVGCISLNLKSSILNTIILTVFAIGCYGITLFILKDELICNYLKIVDKNRE